MDFELLRDQEFRFPFGVLLSNHTTVVKDTVRVRGTVTVVTVPLYVCVCDIETVSPFLNQIYDPKVEVSKWSGRTQ